LPAVASWVEKMGIHFPGKNSKKKNGKQRMQWKGNYLNIRYKTKALRYEVKNSKTKAAQKRFKKT